MGTSDALDDPKVVAALQVMEDALRKYGAAHPKTQAATKAYNDALTEAVNKPENQ